MECDPQEGQPVEKLLQTQREGHGSEHKLTARSSSRMFHRARRDRHGSLCWEGLEAKREVSTLGLASLKLTGLISTPEWPCPSCLVPRGRAIHLGAHSSTLANGKNSDCAEPTASWVLQPIHFRCGWVREGDHLSFTHVEARCHAFSLFAFVCFGDSVSH